MFAAGSRGVSLLFRLADRVGPYTAFSFSMFSVVSRNAEIFSRWLLFPISTYYT